MNELPDYIASPKETAQVLGATVLPEICPDCKVWNQFMKPEQGLPFCWGCVTDKRTAAEGRTLLLKAKLAAKGIIVEEARPMPAAPSIAAKRDEEDDERPFWPDGIPL